MRCTHEAQLHKQNCFITLTYNDENLPEFGSLNKTDLQKFFKRLRKTAGSFRYYACGEYGERTQRAHYHACLFGIDFQDKIHFRTIKGNHLYTSETLKEIWGLGNTSVGSLTMQSAAYTASYVMQRTLGKGCPRFVRHDTETSELIPLQQPYAVMSLRAAIGRTWIEKYHRDIYGGDKDSIQLQTKKLRPAKYYDKIYDIINNDHMQYIKAKRRENTEGNTNDELRAREKINNARAIFKTQI